MMTPQHCECGHELPCFEHRRQTRNESAEWLRRNVCSCRKADHDYYCPVHDLDKALATERRNVVDEIRERCLIKSDAAAPGPVVRINESDFRAILDSIATGTEEERP